MGLSGIWKRDYRYFGDVRVGESHQILTGAIKLSFGTYMLLYMALILLFAIASIVIIDFIGRTIGNYMGAVAVSIPVCGAMMFLMRRIYYMLFLITNDQVLACWGCMHSSHGS